MKVFSTTAYRIYIVHSHWPKAWNNTSPCLPRVAEILTVLQRLPVPCGVWVEGTQRHRAAALVQDGHWQVTPAERLKSKTVFCVSPSWNIRTDQKIMKDCGSFVPPFCVHVSAGSSVYLAVPQCTTSTGLSNVDMKQWLSSSPSVTRCSSWRIRQRRSAHLAPTSLWISLSTVSLRVICPSPSLWW